MGVVLNGKAKIAVVANCQARPVADLIRILAPGAEITEITVVQLARDEDASGALALYSTSDFIFAQAVHQTFATEFVRTAGLTQKFGDKVATWPNVFYRGQCPDVRYMTGENGRIFGPLGEYQSIPVYEAWRAGLDAAKTTEQLLLGGDWVERLLPEPEASLEELRRREESVDVGISDYIGEHWQERRLFHTFNHPATELLVEVVCRLLRHIGLHPDLRALPKGYPEALGRFVPAMLPPMARRLGLRYQGSTVTRGAAVTIAEKVSYNQAQVVNYSMEEFVETSFRCFDTQLPPDVPIRIS